LTTKAFAIFAPATVAVTRPRIVFPRALDDGRKVHVARVPRADPRPATFAAPAVALQRTAEGTRA
jgi:hypothetical protein